MTNKKHLSELSGKEYEERLKEIEKHNEEWVDNQSRGLPGGDNEKSFGEEKPQWLKLLYLGEWKGALEEIGVFIVGFLVVGLACVLGLSLIWTLAEWSNADSSFSFISVFTESFKYSLLFLFIVLLYFFLFEWMEMTGGMFLLLITLVFFSGSSALVAIMLVLGLVYYLKSIFTAN